MNFRSKLQVCCRLLTILLLLCTLVLPTSSLTEEEGEGANLLFFKYHNIKDPLSVFKNWNSRNNTPCSWTGVTCGAEFAGLRRVIKLDLPNKRLSGSIPGQLGKVKHLQYINFSNNLFSGSIPESIRELYDLKVLDLSHNDLWGNIPYSLGNLPSLTELYLRNNHFTGHVPWGFRKIEVLDLSSNMISNSLPGTFSGENLHYLNYSRNLLSGEVQGSFVQKIPVSAIVDLSYNNLTGEVTESIAAKVDFLSGNPGLCGKPLNISCVFGSTPGHTGTLDQHPEPSPETGTPGDEGRPQLAPSPKPGAQGNRGQPQAEPSPKPGEQRHEEPGPKTVTPGNGAQRHAESKLTKVLIAIIIIIAVMLIVLLVYLLVIRAQERKQHRDRHGEAYTCRTSKALSLRSCIRRKGLTDMESFETKWFTSESEGQDENNEEDEENFVFVNGEIKLQLETLLKPPLDIIGSSPSNIVFRTMLNDGTMLAVRRIEETNLNRLDVIKRVSVVSKLHHPNLLHLRGFYWDNNHKLFIYEYFPMEASQEPVPVTEATPSRYQLPWRARLKIARGVARGLAYLHRQKQVHGNLKPSNILLDHEMEPKISDFGLERLVFGARSNRSNSLHSPYDAPESLKSLNPNYKWDVYSFGIVMLELLTGRVFSEADLTQWNTTKHWKDAYWLLRMVHMDIASDVEDREDGSLVTCFNIGFSCASLVQQKRPSMNKVVHVLENIPTSSGDNS